MITKEELKKALANIKRECENNGLSAEQVKQLFKSLLAIPAVMPLLVPLLLKMEFWMPGAEDAIEMYKDALDEWLRK